MLLLFLNFVLCVVTKIILRNWYNTPIIVFLNIFSLERQHMLFICYLFSSAENINIIASFHVSSGMRKRWLVWFHLCLYGPVTKLSSSANSPKSCSSRLLTCRSSVMARFSIIASSTLRTSVSLLKLYTSNTWRKY